MGARIVRGGKGAEGRTCREERRFKDRQEKITFGEQKGKER